MRDLTPERIVRLEPDAVVLLDQRRLPEEEVELRCTSAAEVADAIRTLAIRGAPAIGVSDAVLQIGNSEYSIAGIAARNGSACAPKTPSGAASAAAAPERNNVRRSSPRLPGCFSFDIVLLLMPLARDHACRNAGTALPPGTVKCLIWFSPDENSQLSFR